MYQELHTLFTFVNGCLGDYGEFKSSWEYPITKVRQDSCHFAFAYSPNRLFQAREKGATDAEIRQGTRKAAALRDIYDPFILRRTKDDIVNAAGPDAMSLTLPKKTDWIVWIKLTQQQIDFYRMLLNSDEVKWVISCHNRHAI